MNSNLCDVVQGVDKYYPRAKVRHINKKKQYNEKMRSKFTDSA